jgi:hypothetical protein
LAGGGGAASLAPTVQRGTREDLVIVNAPFDGRSDAIE